MAASKKSKAPKAPKGKSKKAAPKKAAAKKPAAKKLNVKKAAAPAKSAKLTKSTETKASKMTAVKTAAPKQSNAKQSNAKKSNAKKSVAPLISAEKTKTQKTSAVSYAKFFNPLDDRIVVDILPAPTKTAGGLFIPDSGQEKPERGVVVAVGPGKRNKKAQLRPLDVKIGDEVIFAKYAGTAIEILGKEVFILREDEVLGIVN